VDDRYRGLIVSGMSFLHIRGELLPPEEKMVMRKLFGVSCTIGLLAIAGSVVASAQTRPENPPGLRQENPPGVRPENPPGLRQENPPGVRPENPPGARQENPPGVRPENPPGGRPENPPGKS
jgi:hypothetical protein